jgi:septum site-determining protein MinD
MAGRIVTITSGKGGVGKTTTTGNLGVALAKLGKRVICLDLDIGLRSLDLILGLESQIVYDIMDVIEGRVRWHQALARTARAEGLFLLPASQWREKSDVTAEQITRLCSDLSLVFDFVLLDCPAGIEEGFKNAIAPANEIIIVTTPDVPAVRGADRVVGILESIHKPSPTLILNRIQNTPAQQGYVLETPDVLEILGIELIGMIPEDPTIIINTSMGLPAVLAKRSEAGAAITRIARRLMGEQVPFTSPSAPDWWSQITGAWSSRFHKRVGV